MALIVASKCTPSLSLHTRVDDCCLPLYGHSTAGTRESSAEGIINLWTLIYEKTEKLEGR
jgi:hypothetical protein